MAEEQRRNEEKKRKLSMKVSARNYGIIISGFYAEHHLLRVIFVNTDILAINYRSMGIKSKRRPKKE